MRCDLKNKNEQLIALAATIAISIAVIAALIFGSLGWNQDALTANVPSQPEEQEIFLEAELLDLGETNPETEDQPAASAKGEPELSDVVSEELNVNDDNPKPVPAQPRQVTTRNESPVKNTKASKNDREESTISSNVRNAFSSKNGKPDGVDGSSGAGGAGIGVSGSMKGRKMISCPHPSITIAKEVTITVRITVDEAGNVTQASFKSDSGAGAGVARLRNACVSASKRAKWTEKKGTPTQTGVIVWHLKPRT